MNERIFLVVLFVLTSTLESEGEIQKIQLHGRYRTTPPRWKHPSLSALFAGNSTETVPIHNFFNREYTGTIGIGIPEQNFHVVFDTGSADLWVMSAQATQQTAYQHYYDHDASLTYVADGNPWEIKYGSGDASGFLSKDSVFLGTLQANRQLLGEGLIFDGFDNIEEPSDGIMGMGLQVLSTSNTPTVMETLASQNVIKSNVFGLVLSSTNGDDESYLVIGPPEEDESFANGVTYSDIIPPFWTAPMAAVAIGGIRRTDLCTSLACVALLDSGTSFIGIPENIYVDFMSDIIKDPLPQCSFDQSMTAVSCKNTVNLPNITFTFNGFDFTLTPDDYREEDGELGFMTIPPYDNGLSPQTDQFILGDTFIKTFPTVFDEHNSRIGFAHTAYVSPSNTLSGPTLAPIDVPDGNNDLNNILNDKAFLGLKVWQIALIGLGLIFCICFLSSVCCRKSSSARRIRVAQAPANVRTINSVVAVPNAPPNPEQTPYIRMDTRLG